MADVRGSALALVLGLVVACERGALPTEAGARQVDGAAAVKSEVAAAAAPAAGEPARADRAEAIDAAAGSAVAAPAVAAPVVAPPVKGTTRRASRLPPEDVAARGEAMVALDEGRLDDAAKILKELIGRHPGNFALAVLHEGTMAAIDASEADAAALLLNATPIRLGRPPFAATVNSPVAVKGEARAPRLVKIAEAKNQITDDAEWSARTGVRLPLLEVPNRFLRRPGALPAGIPATYGESVLVAGIVHGDHTVLLYGGDYSGGRYVALLDGDRRLTALLDFEDFRLPPEFKATDRLFIDEEVHWGEVVDGVLYVSHFHRTYASSSKGLNGYISAIDVGSGALLWQSRPLVANARNFVIVGRWIITGYGFTDERDFLYVLDRASGAVVAEVKVASGPEVIAVKGEEVLVRTYDTDYVFRIE